MLNVYTPFTEGFPYQDLKELYENSQHLIEDDQSFDDLLVSTMFFGFKEDEKTLGGIYFYTSSDRKTYVNAFAGRNTKESNFKCFKWCLLGFKQDIYAKSHQKTAIYALYRAGFKKIGKDLYIYRRK